MHWLSPRTRALALAGLLVVALSAVAALLPVPYVALQPGPVTNTLGAVGGKDLIRIDGRRTYPDKGRLDLVTVSVAGGPRARLDILTALVGWWRESIAVIPEEQVYPPGQTAEQAERQSQAEMRDSQENATTAALRYLGIPVTTRILVDSLAKKSPSQGLLRAGDQLLTVDGKPVAGGAQLRELITRHDPGDPVELGVLRDGARRSVTVTTAAADGHAIIGIYTRDTAEYPFSVQISLKDVGGPSAGLMFALGIVDKLTPDSLTGGRHIAGTGTIDDAGRVGAIGGITQKMIGAQHAGATVFLVPPGNCDQAVRTAPDGLRLVKARSLTDAVRALDLLRERRLSALPRC